MLMTNGRQDFSDIDDIEALPEPKKKSFTKTVVRMSTGDEPCLKRAAKSDHYKPKSTESGKQDGWPD